MLNRSKIFWESFYFKAIISKKLPILIRALLNIPLFSSDYDACLIKELKVFIDYFAFLYMKEITYNEAQEKESLRQDYLNQFFKKYPEKSVLRIVYNKNEGNFKKHLNALKIKGKITEKDYNKLIKSFKKHEGTDMNLFAFCPRGEVGKGISPKIFVNPVCFKLDFMDFVSILVDHEYIHAKHVKEGIKLKEGLEISYLNQNFFTPEVLLLLDESVAYINTIEKAIERDNLSPQIKELIKAFRKIQEELQSINKFNSVIEEASVKFQIKNNLRALQKYSEAEKR